MAKEKIVAATRGFFTEFKSFAVKGNALELAVAVVIGAAFTGVVNSLVGDLITPLLGFFTGSADFKNLTLVLREAGVSAAGSTTPAVVLRYGSFIQTVFNFLLVSLAIFVVFKALSAARRRVFVEGEKAVPPHEKPAQERLLEEIRDLLRRKGGEPTGTSALKDES